MTKYVVTRLIVVITNIDVDRAIREGKYRNSLMPIIAKLITQVSSRILKKFELELSFLFFLIKTKSPNVGMVKYTKPIKLLATNPTRTIASSELKSNMVYKVHDK